MKLKRKIIVIYFLSIFTFTNFYCQKKEQINKDELSKHRQLFWDSLPKSSNFVNDYENLFTDVEDKELNLIIGQFNIKTKIEIAIVTLDTIVVSKEKFDDLTLHIAKTWGIGKKELDNGILIGISKGYKKIRIQNGNGIELILSNEETKEILDFTSVH